VPTYDYVCTECGQRMEVVHGIHEQGPTTCPVCGGRVRKAVAAPAVHFKGSGWAKKDRGAAVATRAAAKADAGGDGASESSSEGGDEGAAAGPDKPDKPDKADKSEKSDKSDKSDKSARVSTSSDRSTRSAAPASAEAD
jgi:putative FmdB family regulatory protein